MWAMELIIRTGDGAGADLYQWLSADPELRGQVTIKGADVEPGGMGVGLDVLGLVIPNTIALGSLIMSIVSFQQQRRQSTGALPPVSIGNGGASVDIDGDGTDALRKLTSEQSQP